MRKKLFFLTGLALASFSAKAQISTFPTTESFNAPFSNVGENVYVYPSFLVNTVETSARVFRDVAVYNTPPAAISIIPTGSFDGEITASVSIPANTSIVVSFFAKSVSNGTGSRPAKLTMSTSFDGGTTWTAQQHINSFPNSNQPSFAEYSYSVPAPTVASPNAKVKFFVETGDGGSGTRAKLVIDDILFSVTAAPQLAASANSLSFTQVSGTVSELQTISVSGSNLTQNVSLTVNTPFEISLTQNGTFASSQTIQHNNGNLTSTPVYLRLNATASGASTGNLTIESANATSLTIPLTGNTVAVTATEPVPFDLYNGDYTFSEWNATAPKGTFPESMAFWTHATTDPGIEILFVENYICGYNLESRSRFNGLDTMGISMVNTGNSQYVGVCDGTNPSQSSGEAIENGRSGAIVLALNTLDQENISIAWTGRTIAKNNRVYALRMQYKTTTGNINSGWMDIPATTNSFTEYLSGEDGTNANFTTVLPEAANNKPAVQVRWVYTYKETGVTGSRAEIALDDITVSSEKTLGTDTFKQNTFKIYPNPVKGIAYLNSATDIQVFDYTGKLIHSEKEALTIDTATFASGIYLVKTSEGITKKLVVK